MIFITEFGNVNTLTNDSVKGLEYAVFYEALRNVPGIGAAFGQILSSNSAYRNLAWRAEDGSISEIVETLAQRHGVPT